MEGRRQTGTAVATSNGWKNGSTDNFEDQRADASHDQNIQELSLTYVRYVNRDHFHPEKNGNIKRQTNHQHE